MSHTYPPLLHPMVELDPKLPNRGQATPHWATYFNAVAALNVFDELPLQLPSGSLVGRASAGAGVAEVLTIGQGLTLDGSTLEADPLSVTPFDNTALTVRDASGFFALTIRPASSLTADRTLNFVTGDAGRNITLSGDPTLADWFNQSVKTTASPAFTGLSVNSFTVTVNGAPTLNDWFDQSVKSTASPTFSTVTASTRVDSPAYRSASQDGVSDSFDIALDGGGAVTLTVTNGIVTQFA